MAYDPSASYKFQTLAPPTEAEIAYVRKHGILPGYVEAPRIHPSMRSRISASTWKGPDPSRWITEWEMEQAARPFETGGYGQQATVSDMVRWVSNKDATIIQRGMRDPSYQQTPEFLAVASKHKGWKASVFGGRKITLGNLTAYSRQPHLHRYKQWWEGGSGYWEAMTAQTRTPGHYLGTGGAFPPLKTWGVSPRTQRAYTQMWSRKMGGGTIPQAAVGIEASLLAETRPGAAWGMGEWAHRAARDPYEMIPGSTRDPFRWHRRVASDIQVDVMTGKYKTITEARRARLGRGALKGLGIAGTALFAYGLISQASKAFAAETIAAPTPPQSRVAGRREGVFGDLRRDASHIFNPPMESLTMDYEAGKETIRYASWLGGPGTRTAAGFALAAGEVARGMEQGDLEGVPGMVGGEAIRTATDVIIMKTIGFVAGKLGQGWGILKNKWAQRAARKVAYTGEGRTLTWMADVGTKGGAVSQGAASYAGAAPGPGATAGKAGALSKFWQWMDQPIWGPKKMWNPLATRRKALIYAQTVSKVMASPWLDPRNAAFTYQAYTLSAEEMTARGISPTRAARRREESSRSFFGSSITGIKSLMTKGGWGDINWIQTDPGEALANYGPGTAINLHMAMAFHGKKVERKEIKAAIGRAGPSPYQYAGGDYLGAFTGTVRPGLEYLATMGAVNLVTGGLGGWAAKQGTGRFAKASQAFAFGLMSPNEPLGLAMGWTFAGRSKGPQRLGLGLLMGASAFVTGDVETGKTMGRAAYMGVWGAGTYFSHIGKSAVMPGYFWEGKGSEGSAIRAHMLNRFATTPYQKLNSFERWQLGKFRSTVKQPGMIQSFLAEHFSLYTSLGKYSKQVLTGGAYNPFMRGKEVREAWSPFQIESYMLGKEMLPGQRALPLDEEISLAQEHTAMAYTHPNARARSAASALAMTVPNYLPFMADLGTKMESVRAKTKYYTYQRYGIEYLALKKGEIYDKMAAGDLLPYRGAKEKDVVVSARVTGTEMWVKSPGISPEDFETHIGRFKKRSKRVMESPVLEAWTGVEVTKKEVRKPVFESNTYNTPIGPITLTGVRGAEATAVPMVSVEEAEEDLYSVLISKDPFGAGGGAGYRKKYPPDPVFVHPDNIIGTVPFSDDLLLNALSDSIQEWNWRSPRRGGTPYVGGLN